VYWARISVGKAFHRLLQHLPVSAERHGFSETSFDCPNPLLKEESTTQKLRWKVESIWCLSTGELVRHSLFEQSRSDLMQGFGKHGVRNCGIFRVESVYIQWWLMCICC